MGLRSWWRDKRNKMRIRKKKKIPSVVTLYKKKKHTSKIIVRDIELIDGMDFKDLKKEFHVTKSKVKLLEAMVKDYKQGRLSLPGLSHKSKFDAKIFDQDKFEQILSDYDIAKKKKNEEDIEILRKNVEKLNKKIHLTATQKKIFNKLLTDLEQANRSKFEIIKSQLDPKHCDKENVNNLLAQLERRQKQNKGLSFLFTNSKLTFLPSKRQFSILWEEIKKRHVSGTGSDF